MPSFATEKLQQNTNPRDNCYVVPKMMEWAAKRRGRFLPFTKFCFTETGETAGKQSGTNPMDAMLVSETKQISVNPERTI
jgi:hypothetical protein